MADALIETSRLTDATKINNLPADTTTSLGLKEDSANKGAVSGYASLDANTEVIELPAGAAAATAGFVLQQDGTWVAQSGGGAGDALTTNPLSQFAATTSAQFAGVISDETGTGSVVLSNSPVLTTPNIGSATGSISGNAATVTTNANLTGAVTSVGNAASLGSFTTAQLNTALSDGNVATGGGTATGTNTGDQINITGNAATVTTNANLTGHVTSIGNAAVLGSFTTAQLNTAISDGTVATGGGTATGTNTGDQTTVTGNAGTATALETARTIAGVSFNGTANIAIASTNLSDTASIALLTSTQTLTNKTLTDPKITSALNTQVGTTYTLALTDASKVVELNNAAANVVTIPLNATIAFPIGTTLTIIQIGAGLTSATGAAGVTVNGVSGGTKATTATYEGLALYKRGTDEWVVVNK